MIRCSCPDAPSMYTVLSILVYVMSHAGGVRSCPNCPLLPEAVEDDEAEGVESLSVGKPMSD